MKSRGEFTEDVKEEVTVDFQRFYVKVGGVRYDVKMKYVSIWPLFSLWSNTYQVLEALLSNIAEKPLSYKAQSLTWKPYSTSVERKEILTQDYLWAVHLPCALF